MGKKIYYKEIDNKIIFYKGENIILGEWRICNPTDEQLEEAGWKEYIPEEHKVPDKTLDQIKKEKIIQIEEYDTSNAINEFFIEKSGITVSFWGNKTDRASLKVAVEDYLRQGIFEYRLDIREQGISIVIDCQKLLDILSMLEVYATQCYNVTTDHIYAVNNLKTIEEVNNYDYTSNYPEKLIFHIN